MILATQRLVKIFQLWALSMGFYFLARLEFFVWNHNLYHDKRFADIVYSFVVGLRFDISATMMLVAIPLLWSFVPWPQQWQRFWKISTWCIYLTLQIPFYLLSLGDTEYSNFVGRRFSFDSLFILNEVNGKMGNFLQSYWSLFVVNTLLVAGFFYFSFLVLWRGWQPSKTAATSTSASSISNSSATANSTASSTASDPVSQYLQASSKRAWLKSPWWAHGFLCFVTLVVFVIGIRGGLQRKPLSFVHANVFAAPVLNNLILNSAFTFLKSMKEDGIKHNAFFQQKSEMLSYLNGSLSGPSLLEGHRLSKKQNVVIIILESFSLEYIGPQKNKVSFTPFLDELSQHSLVFTNAYANGRRSIEGVGAVLAGVPAMMNEPFISSHFMSNYFLGLGSVVERMGYHSSFFHGANNGSMYFDSFIKSVGIENYFGAQEFPNQEEHDGVWGIWDDAFFPFMLQKLNGFHKPFLSAVFSLTSHQPYKVPARAEGKFPEGPLPILKCIAYTDQSLRDFFEQAKKQDWYNDTLFVITADHTAAHFQEDFKNNQGDYRIPLIFYHPQMQWPAVDTEQVVQQIDILPSVLDFLNTEPPEKNYLGRSVFVPGDRVAVDFIDGKYLLFAKNYFMRWDLGAPEPVMFNIQDRAEKTPLEQPSAELQRYSQKMKASIQYFGEAMWDNKLYYPSAGR